MYLLFFCCMLCVHLLLSSGYSNSPWKESGITNVVQAAFTNFSNLILTVLFLVHVEWTWDNHCVSSNIYNIFKISANKQKTSHLQWQNKHLTTVDHIIMKMRTWLSYYLPIGYNLIFQIHNRPTTQVNQPPIRGQ